MIFKIIISFLCFIAFSVSAQQRIPNDVAPFKVDINGNTYTFNHAPSGTAHSSIYFRNPTVSNTSPAFTSSVAMPFKHKGGGAATATMTWPIDTKKVSEAATKAAKAGVAGASTGNGYIALASVACAFVCDPLVDLLLDSGLSRLQLDSSGSLTAPVPDSSYYPSDGYEWRSNVHPRCSGAATVASAICVLSIQHSQPQTSFGSCTSRTLSSTSVEFTCLFNNSNPLSVSFTRHVSTCPIGSYINDGICYSDPPTNPLPLGQYLQSTYTGKGWSRHWADLTAALVASGENVFTDGTGTTITGPAIIPVSVTETKTEINLLPGTTTPVTPGHTGSSDSGTQTVTSTTNAHNNYRPGSAIAGPSMTTTQKTTTTTSITNNVTNVTNITNTTETEVDKSPEEEVSDTPLAEIPSLYDQKYPNGLSGVISSKVQQLKETPLFRLPSDLMGDLPSTGQCPSWQLDLNLSSWAPLGVYDIGADCSIWEFASLVVLISALILCRALIFGG